MQIPKRRPVVEVMDERMADMLRRKTPQERLEISVGMWETARVMLRGIITQNHPDWPEERILREIAKRISHGVVDHDRIGNALV